MNIRKTTEQFRQEVYELVGDEYEVLGEYINNCTKIKMKHNQCGYQWDANPSAFLYINTKCPQCHGTHKKTTQEFKQEVYDLIGDEYEVLGEYMNANTKIRMQHNICQHKWDVNPSTFLHGTRCPKCYGSTKKTTEQFRQEVYELVGDEYEVLGEYINNCTKIKMKHNQCGYQWDANPNAFTSAGTRCPQCKRIIDKHIINPITLFSYKSEKEMCQAVGISYSIYQNRKHANWSIEDALYIPKNYSFGEYKICQYLDRLNIKYYHDITVKSLFKELQFSHQQYEQFMQNYISAISSSINETISKARIQRFRYDFAIINKAGKLSFIEFDGEQHFKFVSVFFKTLEEFLLRHSTDELKNLFATTNGIPLLRIRYDQIEKIPDFINDFLDNPQNYIERHNPELDEKKYWEPFKEKFAQLSLA